MANMWGLVEVHERKKLHWITFRTGADVERYIG